MRPATLLGALVLLFLLGVAALLGASGGAGSDAALSVRWTSDTARDSLGNHHAPAAGVVDGRSMVYAPISGRANTDECDLVALFGENGSRRWHYPVPAANCTLHSVADPTVADYDGDGTAEVLAATTERAVVALHPVTGAEEARFDLPSYGYTKPVVTDLVGDGTAEVVVVDARGAVSVFRPDGSAMWTRQLSTYTWGQPAVVDADADGAPELFVGLGGPGRLLLFEANGTVRWDRTAPFGSAITWLATGETNGEPGVDAVAATEGGAVVAVDGRDGSVVWRRDLGSFAAVHAVGDGDGDGAPEVYAVARDATLRSLDARNGTVEWETTLTSRRVQMAPPPALGDLDGDGAPEVVAVTNDGIVAVVDPTTGTVTATYERDAPIYTHPTLADLDGDGTLEAVVIYGDGRVVALSYRSG